MAEETGGVRGQTRPPDGNQDRGRQHRRWGGQGPGGRVFLPEGIRRDLNRRKRIPNTVSLGFEKFREMPTSRELGEWLVEQELHPEKGFDVKRISRSEHDNRFYLQLEGEGMVDRLVEAIGHEGREWKTADGQVQKIQAVKEGDQWLEVKIANIDPDTPQEQVVTNFSHIGEVKDFKQDDIKGMVLDSASLKVKLKEEMEMPTYLVVKGVPGDKEGVVRWDLNYRNKPRVCYRCYQGGHWRRECRNPAVPITALLARTDLAEGGVRGSYAQAVKSKEAVQAETEKKVELEKKKKLEEEEKERQKQEWKLRKEVKDKEKEEAMLLLDAERKEQLILEKVVKETKMLREKNEEAKEEIQRRKSKLEDLKKQVEEEEKEVKDAEEGWNARGGKRARSRTKERSGEKKSLGKERLGSHGDRKEERRGGSSSSRQDKSKERGAWTDSLENGKHK